MEGWEPVTTIDTSKTPPPGTLVHIEPVVEIPLILETSLERELRELGWVRKRDGFSGLIRGNYAAYDGYLYDVGGGRLDLFIKNPPHAFIFGRKRMCIHQRQYGWFYVNFASGRSLIERIFTVQDYLKESGG